MGDGTVGEGDEACRLHEVAQVDAVHVQYIDHALLHLRLR